MEWEDIDNWHKRTRVPGGWIVKAYENVTHDTHQGMSDGWDWRVAMCFVPDLQNLWTLPNPSLQPTPGKDGDLPDTPTRRG